MSRTTIFTGLFLFCVLSNVLQAQPVKQYYFTHYTHESGLISTEVNSVVQDPDGYIWVGTVDGLQRFDGTRFKTFQHSEKDRRSIPSNNILQVLLDKKNRLWLLTAQGDAGIFDTRDFRFRQALVKEKTPGSKNASVKRLIMDEYGNVFLLLAGIEVLTWDERKNEFSAENNFFETPPGSGVGDFIQQPGTFNYWISGGKGIGVYNRSTRTLSYAGNNKENIPAVDVLANFIIPFHFHFDKKGRCWFQTWQTGMPEAYRFDPAVKNPVVERYAFHPLLKAYYETYQMFEQKDGTIWIKGLNLLAKFMEEENRFQLVHNGYLNERSISYERLTSLTEDREKNIWVGTDNNGLYRFNPSEQYFINTAHTSRATKEPGKGSVLSFITTNWGTILAGTWSDGLYQYDRNFNLLPLNIRGISEQAGPSVWGLYASRDSNTIWMAAQPGIYALNQATRSAAFYNPPSLNNRTVRQVVEDKQGNLWLGMNNYGLFKWPAADKDKRNADGIQRFDPIPPGMVNRVTVDSKGFIWVGTAMYGIYMIDPVSNKVVLHLDDSNDGNLKLPDTGISAILEYSDSIMVLTTSRHMLMYDRYKKRMYTLGSAGLMKGYIASMEKDRKGYVWVSTTTGLYRVNIKTRAFVMFNRNDGIDNDHFILAASRALPDGRILFGSSTQFIAFCPDSINISATPPLPRITDFKVMNRSLLVDSLLALKRIELRYNKNSLEIDFSPMVYSGAFAVMYKLEGLDKEWKMADKNNQAIYSYLPSGKYSFLMKTVDAEAKMSDAVSTLDIRVIPPFWKSWWFFIALAMLIGILFYWFDRERMNRKEAIQRMRSNIADNLHSEVNAALNNINILSEMARLKADKDPGKSKEYIEQIHSKSHNMIIAMDDMLWSLDPGNDSMEKTTDRMREYIDALKNRYGVNIDIAVDRKVETLPLNMKLRHDAFLVFKEGLKNLVTLGAENLHVYIKSDKNDLLFITLFDSEHCDMLQLNNLLHRQDLEKRLLTLKANIEVDLHKNHSSITLRVPAS